MNDIQKISILIVSGNRSFIEKIKHTLRKESLIFEEAVNEDIGTAKAIHFNYSIIFIDKDSSTARTNMVHVIKERELNIPIIIFAEAFNIEQKIYYLEKGVDMLIEKTVHPKIIEAQISSLIKKSKRNNQNIIKIKNLKLHTISNEAIYKKKRIALRKKEFDLLAHLACNPNTIFSRNELYKRIWKKDDMRSNTVDSHIKELRKKLGESATSLIKTIHARGYAMII